MIKLHNVGIILAIFRLTCDSLGLRPASSYSPAVAMNSCSTERHAVSRRASPGSTAGDLTEEKRWTWMRAMLAERHGALVLNTCRLEANSVRTLPPEVRTSWTCVLETFTSTARSCRSRPYLLPSLKVTAPHSGRGTLLLQGSLACTDWGIFDGDVNTRVNFCIHAPFQ